MCSCSVVVFFFFKQKTAYEMRISDWSSDVCSSDLDFNDRDAVVYGASTDSEFVHLAWRRDHEDLRDLPFPMLADLKRELSSALGILHEEIGRASCRERVCQYV